MATRIFWIVEKYNEVMAATEDPVVNSWMFMGSPAPIVLILMLYLYFILKLGPQLMKNRPPFELKNVLIAYNAYQIVFTMWLLSLSFRVENWFNIIFEQCGTIHSSSEFTLPLRSAAWWYLLNKIVELLDTVFFVLRKKQSQVTFLHVYHHFLMVFFTWMFLRFFPGEQGALIGSLNAIVHIVMYSYYLIAALGPEYQKYLWWKKYMTWLQLTQFFLMLAYLIYVTVKGCPLPYGITAFFFINIVIFLYLFADFYRKAYLKEKETPHTQNKRLNKLE